MKFFNISALKSDISNGALTQGQVFRYWMASATIVCLSGAPLSLKSSASLWVFWVFSGAINLFGLRKCYLANGGSGGIAFSDKLVSLGWVVSVRGVFILFLPLLVGSGLVLCIISVIWGFTKDDTEMYADLLVSLVTLIYSLWVWLKTSSHIRQLR